MSKFVDYPLAASVVDDDLVLIWQDSTGLVKTAKRGVAVGHVVLWVPTIAALKAMNVAPLVDNQQVMVGGYYANGDGGGGLFQYQSGSGATDDGGLVIAPTVGAGRFLRVVLTNTFTPAMFGAKGDGLTDDTSALKNAVSAVAVNGTLDLGSYSKVYIINDSLVLDKKMNLIGSGAILKLGDLSALYTNNNSGLYGRYIIHVRASGCVIDGVQIDGNSPNNYVVIGGITRFRYSGGGAVYSVGAIVVGYVPLDNTPVVSSPIYDVSIRNCRIWDSSDTCISFFNQDGVSYFFNCETRGNVFIRGQNVQHDMNNTRGCRAMGNTHTNAYFASFQFYYNNRSSVCADALVYHKDSEINTALVDPGLLSGGVLIFHGYFKLGKDASSPNVGCGVKNCTLYGTGIYLATGMDEGFITGCTIDSAEKLPGIDVEPSVSGNSNVISNNLVLNCDFPGIYHGPDNPTGPTFYRNNVLLGNNQSALQYGGRDQFSNIFIIGNSAVMEGNVARKIGTKPDYGVRIYEDAGSSINTAGSVFRRNDFAGSGNVADWFPATKHPVGAMLGCMNYWEWTRDATEEQASAFDLVPTGDGILILSGTTVGGQSEMGVFNIKRDGTVTMLSGTANMSTTDLPNKLCVVDNGTNVYIRNETGTAMDLRAVFFYK